MRGILRAFGCFGRSTGPIEVQPALASESTSHAQSSAEVPRVAATLNSRSVVLPPPQQTPSYETVARDIELEELESDARSARETLDLLEQAAGFDLTFAKEVAQDQDVPKLERLIGLSLERDRMDLYDTFRVLIEKLHYVMTQEEAAMAGVATDALDLSDIPDINDTPVRREDHLADTTVLAHGDLAIQEASLTEAGIYDAGQTPQELTVELEFDAGMEFDTGIPEVFVDELSIDMFVDGVLSTIVWEADKIASDLLAVADSHIHRVVSSSIVELMCTSSMETLEMEESDPARYANLVLALERAGHCIMSASSRELLRSAAFGVYKYLRLQTMIKTVDSASQRSGTISAFRMLHGRSKKATACEVLLGSLERLVALAKHEALRSIWNNSLILRIQSSKAMRTLIETYMIWRQSHLGASHRRVQLLKTCFSEWQCSSVLACQRREAAEHMLQDRDQALLRRCLSDGFARESSNSQHVSDMFADLSVRYRQRVVGNLSKLCRAVTPILSGNRVVGLLALKRNWTLTAHKASMILQGKLAIRSWSNYSAEKKASLSAALGLMRARLDSRTSLVYSHEIAEHIASSLAFKSIHADLVDLFRSVREAERICDRSQLADQVI